jgi:hypothetical protein
VRRRSVNPRRLRADLPDRPASGTIAARGTLDRFKTWPCAARPGRVPRDLARAPRDLAVRRRSVNPRRLRADLPDRPASGTIAARGTLDRFET